MSASTSVSAPVSSPTSFLTPNRILLMNNMSAILAGVSLAFCLAVLGLVALIYSNRESRKSLDRLSFRLLVYALISNCIYSIGYIICVKVSPGFWCVAGVWLIQFWLGVTNWFILCIALNLQLVLVHSLNGLTLEKYYIMGTFLLNIAITLPPLIKGKFGWDPVIGVCWLTESDPHERLVWQISTQILWIFLAVLVTFICAIITMGYLYKHKFTTKDALNSHGDSVINSIPRFRDIPMLDEHGKPVISCKKLRRSATKLASRSLSGNRRFRNIILRISIYPVVMIVLNFFITVADLRISTAEGIYTQDDYYLYVAYYAFYGGRGIFYALMAIIDPSIIRGIRVWRGLHSNSSENGEGELDFSLGSGIINVQAEIIRFVEELGLYPSANNRHNSDATGSTFGASSIEIGLSGTSSPIGPDATGISEGNAEGLVHGQDSENPESTATKQASEVRQTQQDRIALVQAVQLQAEMDVKRQI